MNEIGIIVFLSSIIILTSSLTSSLTADDDDDDKRKKGDHLHPHQVQYRVMMEDWANISVRNFFRKF